MHSSFNKNFTEHPLSARHGASHRDIALKKMKFMVRREARREIDNHTDYQ